MTMLLLLDDLIGLIAPHKCKGCGVVGSTFCSRCVNETIGQIKSACIYCGARTVGSNLCSACRNKHSQFNDIYMVGYRTGALKSLVGDYKYHSEVASCRPIAQLLLDRVKDVELPADSVIVPITTTPVHVRQRGFDHMVLIARELSWLSGKRVETGLLVRLDNAVQHELSSAERHKRIKTSLALSERYLARHKAPESVILLDDIWTTGATMEWAATLLRRAGVKKVFGLTLCRQPK